MRGGGEDGWTEGGGDGMGWGDCFGRVTGRISEWDGLGWDWMGADWAAVLFICWFEASGFARDISIAFIAEGDYISNEMLNRKQKGFFFRVVWSMLCTDAHLDVAVYLPH